MEVKEITDDYQKYYEKMNIIGKGQFGIVYKGKNNKTQEIIAIKILAINEEDKDFMKNINNELIKEYANLFI